MNDFTSNNNKIILWDLLNTNNAFINKTQNDAQQMFESMIINVNSDYKNESLINKNKMLISNIMKAINDPPHRATKKETKNEIIQIYESKQNEMNDFLKPAPPKEVTFTEDKDEPIKDLDREIELQMEKRKLDIAITDQSNNTMVSDWINGKTSSMPKMQEPVKIPENPNKLKIEEKRVHWAPTIENNTINDNTSLNDNTSFNDTISLSDIMKKLNEIDEKLNRLLK